MKPRLIHITIVPISLKIFLKDQLKFINRYFYIVCVSPRRNNLEDVRKRERIRTVAFKMVRKITPLQNIISLWKMIYLLYKKKPAIIHTYTLKAEAIDILATWIARVLHRLYIVTDLPVVKAKGKKKQILLWIEKFTYAYTIKIYLNSNKLKPYFLEYTLTTKHQLKTIGYNSKNCINIAYLNQTEKFQKAI